MKNKVLILGMGNSILSDDAIGLIIAEKVFNTLNYKSQIKNHEYFLELAETGGMMLIDIIKGHDKVVIIDSIKTGKFLPGEVVEISAERGIGSHRLLSSHDVSIFECLEIGKGLKHKMPGSVRIFGIEIINNEEFGEKLSPEIQERVEAITKEILKTLKK